ncbi:MAG: HAD family phosphatase [Nitriliruptorales bacterium]|nr:HAD family phosphatase [Nitriliruptorales bacterium]
MIERRLPAAVVFDCDGTIVDTETVSDVAWHEVLGRYGYTPTEADLLEVTGTTWPAAFRHFRERVDIGDDPSVFREELRGVFHRVFDEEVEFFHDVLGVLRELADHDVPVAVASSSSREHVDKVLDTAGVANLVMAVFGAEDTERNKPHPDPYLAAAQALGAEPSACSAVEDSDVGIEAAKAAGMWVVAMDRGRFPREALAKADRLVEELTLGDLHPV